MGELTLKPCPFCGGRGEVRLMELSVDREGRGIDEMYTVRCRDCNATTGQRRAGRYARVNGEFIVYKDGYMAAVEDWNRRAYEAVDEPGPVPEDGGPS